MNINQLTASKGREIRINKGLSAEGVAKELGISKSSYSDLENGKTQRTLNKIESLANIFSVPLNDLIPSGNYSQVHNGDAEII